MLGGRKDRLNVRFSGRDCPYEPEEDQCSR